MNSVQRILEWNICINERHQMLLEMLMKRCRDNIKRISNTHWITIEENKSYAIKKYLEKPDEGYLIVSFPYWDTYVYGSNPLEKAYYNCNLTSCLIEPFEKRYKNEDLLELYTKTLQKKMVQFEVLFCQYSYWRCNHNSI